LKQVAATVIASDRILPGYMHSRGRSILSNHLIWLKCPEIARRASPGQFVMAHCGEETILPRPFSLHQINGDDLALFFTVWENGKGTGWLSQRQVNDRIELLGPLGKGFSVNPDSGNLLLVAGGVGIAPLVFLAQEALRKGCSVRLLYGTATKHRYPEERLPSGVELVAATEDGSVGHRGLVTELLPDFADWVDQIFACGPVAMYRDMAGKYQQFLKDKPAQISLEVVMACGRGVCYGCSIKTEKGLRRVCEDGPVFDLLELDGDTWEALIF
jgi:dihydroorotate dehydrogenase electron transfer subunit